MTITFNPKVKLVLADVDETLADVYTEASPEMIEVLNKFLESGRDLFLISGGGLQSIQDRITSKLNKALLHQVLIGHCSGAEVWGFTKTGELRANPFYSVYNEQFSDQQKKDFRMVVEQILKEYDLITYPTMKVAEFIKLSKQDPKMIMLADRGPQITLEMVNSYAIKDSQGNITDLRKELVPKFIALFEKFNIPAEPAISGVFALDLKVKGVSKVTAIRYILENDMREHGYDFDLTKGKEAEELEMWGDKFSEHSGSDKYLCYALPPSVRAVDFRDEEPSELPKGYNIQLWKGEFRLHEGCLEYLSSYFK